MATWVNGKKVVNAYRVYTEYVTSQIGQLTLTPVTGYEVRLGGGLSGGTQVLCNAGNGFSLRDTATNDYLTIAPILNDGVHFGIQSSSGRGNYNFIFCGSNNVLASYGLSASTNPTIHVASATAVGTSTTQRTCVSHEATYGLVESKTGVQRIVGADGFETQGNAQLDTDGKYSGETAIIDVDSNAVGFAGALYMAADGNLDTADYNAETTAPCVCLAIDTGTGSNKRVLLRGFIREDDWNWTIGPGKTGFIYLGASGVLTQTAPSGVGDVVQIVGWAVTADSMYFNPSLNYIVVA